MAGQTEPFESSEECPDDRLEVCLIVEWRRGNAHRRRSIDLSIPHGGIDNRVLYLP